MDAKSRVGSLGELRPRRLVGLLVAIATVAAATGAVYPLKQVAPPVSLSVVYLPAVLIVSAYWGLALGLFTSLLSAAAFNFFHIPPVGRFTIGDSRNWVALAAFTIVAVVVSAIAEVARSRAAEAERRQAEADLAAALARELLAGAGTGDALGTTARRVAEALAIPSAGIELGASDGDERRRPFALRGANGEQLATLLVPRNLEPDKTARLRAQVVPALEALVAIALRRDALQAEAVETAALRRSDDVKTALLRAVSHDLRTPLTAIVAAGHALGAGSLTPEERSELSSAVVGEGERLATLVDKLLDLSKLQAGGAAPRLDWISLEEVMVAAREGVARRRRRTADDRSRRSCRARRRGAARARIRESARERAPLLQRPARQRPRAADGSARDRAGRRPGTRDHGRRPRADLRAVLPRTAGDEEAVDRVGSRSRDREGIRRGERRHDLGRVAPRAGNRLHRLAPGRARARRRPGAGAWGGGMNDRPRVLVCDDEQQILRALRVILRDAGFEALPASTMEEALDAAAVGRPDAGIIDLVLPDGDGVELCRRLREWTRMPLIVLSAIGDEDAKVRALAAGADDYVTKPFGPRELVARLEANLRRIAPGPEESVISADGLVVDLGRRTVHRDGGEVHLTPTEFDLLRLLASNRGRLMTHRDLLTSVWGAGYGDDTQVLRAHIANLRRKIERDDDPARPRYIRTDPGVGYRFVG